jgi:ParB family chromosome partitioning protein
MALAALPASVIQAFEAPTQLQYRWAAPLATAHQRDAAAVDRVAAALAAMAPKLPAREVFERLVAAPDGQPESTASKDTEPLRFEVQGRAVAQWTRDSRGGGALKVVPGALTPSKERRLVEFLQKLLAG